MNFQHGTMYMKYEVDPPPSPHWIRANSKLIHLFFKQSADGDIDVDIIRLLLRLIFYLIVFEKLQQYRTGPATTIRHVPLFSCRFKLLIMRADPTKIVCCLSVSAYILLFTYPGLYL